MTVTKNFTAPTGSTVKALPFPDGSLADYPTAVQATEASAPDLGKFTIELDETESDQWYLFTGSTTPTSWDDWYLAFDLSEVVDAAALASEISGEISTDVQTAVETAIGELDLSELDLTNTLTVEKLNRYFQTNQPKVVLADTVHGGPHTQILEVGEEFKRAE